MKRQEIFAVREKNEKKKVKKFHAKGKFMHGMSVTKAVSSQNQTHEGQMENSLSPYFMDRIRKKRPGKIYI